VKKGGCGPPPLEEDFGFALRSSERTSYGSHVTYANETTGVRVSLEFREGGIFVELSRLVDGESSSVPIFIESDSVLNSFDLDDVPIPRSARIERLPDTSSWFTADSVERELDRYAGALTEYASNSSRNPTRWPREGKGNWISHTSSQAGGASQFGYGDGC
jgi:hypothetical protein